MKPKHPTSSESQFDRQNLEQNTPQSDAFEISHSEPFVRPQKGSKPIRTGHWNKAQKIRHAMFLQFYSKLFINKSTRKSSKIFKMMSEYVKTRDQNQCRGHYHKAIAAHATQQQIIENAKQLFPKFDEVYLNQIPQLQKLGNGYGCLSAKKSQPELPFLLDCDNKEWQLDYLSFIYSKRQIQGENVRPHQKCVSPPKSDLQFEKDKHAKKCYSQNSQKMYAFSSMTSLHEYSTPKKAAKAAIGENKPEAQIFEIELNFRRWEQQMQKLLIHL